MPDFRKSKYLADAVIDWVAGTTMPAAPSNIYLAMYTQAPTSSEVYPKDHGSYNASVHGIEVDPATYTTYTRESISLGTKSGTNRTVIKNAGPGGISFGANDTGGEVVIEAWVVYDSTSTSTANALYVLTYGGSSEYLTVKPTQSPRIEDDDLEISEE